MGNLHRNFHIKNNPDRFIQRQSTVCSFYMAVVIFVYVNNLYKAAKVAANKSAT